MNTVETGLFKCPQCGMIIHYMGLKSHDERYHPKTKETEEIKQKSQVKFREYFMKDGL